MVRIISGKGITFVFSKTSFTLPPIVQPRIAAHMVPDGSSRQTPTERPPLPCADTANTANRKGELLPTTFRIRIDTVRRQGTTLRIQSRADSESIEPTGGHGFSRPLCPFGNSGKKATCCETE